MRETSSQYPDVHDRQRKQRGQAFVEYVLLVLVLAIIAVVAVKGLGKSVGTTFQQADAALQGGAPPQMNNVSSASLWQRISHSR